tara:strand:+ start:46 stop:315 length:270 start_codon:yes stop_codon:yes gene_type:complete
MGHGSQLEYKSHPARLNIFSFWQAALIQTISACAVGSFDNVTLFEPSAIILLFLTMTHPKGPPLLFALFIESSIALSIKFLFEVIFNFY